MSSGWKFFSAILSAGAVLAVSIALILPTFAFSVRAFNGDNEPLDIDQFREFAQRTEVLAADNSVIATLHGEENRQLIPLDQIPAAVKDSVLSVEDAEFYQHGGVNIRGLVRAAATNVDSGDVAQGGSTITQQLVKRKVVGSERTVTRKIKEAILAMRLESQISKDEILELYLNDVYFGNGAYGVQAAAETYWGKNAGDLNYADSALLAAMIRAPATYDPFLYPDRAKQQRQIALNRIAENGYITKAQATELGQTPLPKGRCTGGDAVARPAECGEIKLPPPDSYFVEMVKEQLLADTRFGETYQERYNAVFGGGLKIYTTLDPVLQAAADNAHATTFPDRVRQEADAKGITTASISIENSTGAVRALVGGPGFKNYKYDIATLEPGRQTGSTFKTFVLLTALEQGAIPSDTVDGGGSWANPGSTPNPYTITGGGGTLTGVTAASSNGAFVRMGQTVGLDNVVNLAQRLGVTSQFDARAKSMPLGVFDVTPMEMASAYSAIPNGGVRMLPYFIERVEDNDGNVILERAPSSIRGVTNRTACYATEILANNVVGGTGTNARLNGLASAGKTGTTESNSNTWFVGFTPYITTAVWMGIPGGNIPMGNLAGREQFGGLWPATIWKNINQPWVDQVRPLNPGWPTCPRAEREGKPLSGAGDPFGVLNGGQEPEEPDPSTTPSTTSSTTSSTTTTVTPRPTTPRPTVPSTTTTLPPVTTSTPPTTTRP